jgi:hypothetical protein
MALSVTAVPPLLPGLQVSEILRTVYNAKAVVSSWAGWQQQQLQDDTVKEVLGRVYDDGFKVRVRPCTGHVKMQQHFRSGHARMA